MCLRQTFTQSCMIQTVFDATNHCRRSMLHTGFDATNNLRCYRQFQRYSQCSTLQMDVYHTNGLGHTRRLENVHCPAAFNLLQLTRFVITARCPRAEDCRHGVFAERHVRTMERSGWFVLR